MLPSKVRANKTSFKALYFSSKLVSMRHGSVSYIIHEIQTDCDEEMKDDIAGQLSEIT